MVVNWPRTQAAKGYLLWDKFGWRTQEESAETADLEKKVTFVLMASYKCSCLEQIY